MRCKRGIEFTAHETVRPSPGGPCARSHPNHLTGFFCCFLSSPPKPTPPIRQQTKQKKHASIVVAHKVWGGVVMLRSKPPTHPQILLLLRPNRVLRNGMKRTNQSGWFFVLCVYVFLSIASKLDGERARDWREISSFASLDQHNRAVLFGC